MTDNPVRKSMLAALLEVTDEGVLSVAPDGTVQDWSAGAERLYGYTAKEIIGEPLTRLIPAAMIAEQSDILSRAETGEIRCCENIERVKKNGEKITVDVKRALLRGTKGTITGMVESGRAGKHNGNGSQDETKLRLLVEQMPVILWTTDLNLRITSNWGNGQQDAGHRPDNLVGHDVCAFLKWTNQNTDPILRHQQALQGRSSHFEHRRNNRVLDIRVEPLRSESGEIVGCIGAGLDITDRKKTEDLVRYEATHDALTGLANYREFMETLEREVRRADPGHHSFTILLMDMDQLKGINDQQGHLAGNHALKRLATAMKEHCRETDLAARYGGDEFAVVLIDSDLGMAKQVASRIAAGLRNAGETPSVTVSIGIGVYPDDGRTAQKLLEEADRQLYRRKKILHMAKASGAR